MYCTFSKTCELHPFQDECNRPIVKKKQKKRGTFRFGDLVLPMNIPAL